MYELQTGFRGWFDVRHVFALVALVAIPCCEGQPTGSPLSAHARVAPTPGATATSPLVAALDEDALRTTITPLFRTLLNGTPKGREQDLGFKSRDEFQQAELGRPFAMFRLDKGPTVTFMGYWRVPIHIGGQARAIVDVGLRDDGYFVAGLGSASFAPTLQKEAERLGMAITGPANHASILRTLSPRNAYLVCPGADGPPSSADKIRALPFFGPPAVLHSSLVGDGPAAACLSSTEISVGDNSN